MSILAHEAPTVNPGPDFDPDAINAALAMAADRDTDWETIDRLAADLLADAVRAAEADALADWLGRLDDMAEECERLAAIERINEATDEASDLDARRRGLGTFGHDD